jgi:energy-coupling factor transporter ATP-binding protein EcfA2
MRLLKLSISGFRGIRSASLNLDEHTVFVGPNGSGKTTIVDSIALLFGRQALLRPLTEHDFFGGTPGPRARFRIVGTIGDFPGNSTERNDQWFRDGRAVPKWWDEDSGTANADVSARLTHRWNRKSRSLRSSLESTRISRSSSPIDLNSCSG